MSKLALTILDDSSERTAGRDETVRVSAAGLQTPGFRLRGGLTGTSGKPEDGDKPTPAKRTGNLNPPPTPAKRIEGDLAAALDNLANVKEVSRVLQRVVSETNACVRCPKPGGRTGVIFVEDKQAGLNDRMRIFEAFEKLGVLLCADVLVNGPCDSLESRHNGNR